MFLLSSWRVLAGQLAPDDICLFRVSLRAISRDSSFTCAHFTISYLACYKPFFLVEVNDETPPLVSAARIQPHPQDFFLVFFSRSQLCSAFGFYVG